MAAEPPVHALTAGASDVGTLPLAGATETPFDHSASAVQIGSPLRDAAIVEQSAPSENVGVASVSMPAFPAPAYLGTEFQGPPTHFGTHYGQAALPTDTFQTFNAPALCVDSQDLPPLEGVLNRPPPLPPFPTLTSSTTTISSDVYIQSAHDTSRFRPVLSERARRSLGVGKASFEKKPRVSQREYEKRKEADYALGWPGPLDVDSAWLRPEDATDMVVAELLFEGKRSEAYAAFVLFVLQCILAGLSIVAGLVAFGTSPSVAGAGIDVAEDPLAHVLRIIEPGLGRLTFVLADACAVGSVLEAAGSYELYQLVVARSGGSGDCGDLDGSTASDTRSRRGAAHRGLISFLHLISNASLVLCCLLSSRGDALLRSTRRTWDPDFARGLLFAQAVFGCAGLVLISPRGLGLFAAPRLTDSAAAAVSASHLSISLNESMLSDL
eukprot:TRINITY_DN17849_c0_g1_i1.p1 TRINITY_DN17849_c0_g1~~TRINITY_DN17849_c0_g1_i1.p1  ORF type:complete len:440 (-),score=16.34 TRINITY_DN17849_c0_g1_i1:8-1327(-)